MSKKSIKIRDIEKLENTSIAATLLTGAAEAGPVFCVPDNFCVDSVGLPPRTHMPICLEAECIVNTNTGAME